MISESSKFLGHAVAHDVGQSVTAPFGFSARVYLREKYVKKYWNQRQNGWIGVVMTARGGNGRREWQVVASMGGD